MLIAIGTKTQHQHPTMTEKQKLISDKSVKCSHINHNKSQPPKQKTIQTACFCFIVNALESIGMLTPSSRLRSTLADTVAMVIDGFVRGTAIEILISGMSFRQPLSSRLLSIWVNRVMAWPDGIYRDRIVDSARHLASRSHLSKRVADLIAT